MHCALTATNHERAQPARGFPVRRSSATRVCLRSCAQAANAALTRTGPPSLASAGQGRRPFRYPRARCTRVGVRESPLQSTRAGGRRSVGARGRHTKMAATRKILATPLARRGGRIDRVARLLAHVARLHHGRTARPPRPITRLAAAARSPARPDPRACCFQLAAHRAAWRAVFEE